MSPSPRRSADESYRAREPVIADNDVGLYSLVGAFHVHRQPERQERRARQLHSYYLAAVVLGEAAAAGEREELGRNLGRLRRDGRGVEPPVTLASVALPF